MNNVFKCLLVLEMKNLKKPGPKLYAFYSKRNMIVHFVAQIDF